MRELETDDLFLLVNVIDEFGVEEIISALEKVDVAKYQTKGKDGKTEVDDEKFGTAILKELVILLLKNLKKCKGSLYELLA